MKTISIKIYDTGDRNFDIRNPDKLVLELTVKILDSEVTRFCEMIKNTYFESNTEIYISEVLIQHRTIETVIK